MVDFRKMEEKLCALLVLWKDALAKGPAVAVCTCGATREIKKLFKEHSPPACHMCYALMKPKGT